MTLFREFADTRKTYKAIQDYNERHLNLVISLCPYQKGDKVRLVRYLKYFPDVKVGEVANVSNVDWNEEYNYLLSVSFPHIPKRYFWMPAYLFRSADWEDSGNIWTRVVKGYRLEVEKMGDGFFCSLFKEGETLNEFKCSSLDQSLDTLESVWHSYRITHRPNK
jgi:hypothetical protein